MSWEKELIELNGELMDLAGDSDQPDRVLAWLIELAELVTHLILEKSDSISYTEAMVAGRRVAIKLFRELVGSDSQGHQP